MGVIRCWMISLSIFLTFGSGITRAQILNMSHDLVPLGIAAQNLTPNTPSLDARPLIQAAGQYVQGAGITTLTLDPGNYYLLSNEYPNSTVITFYISNVTIDFAGSTLYFVGPMIPGGIVLFECTNVTLTNLTTDFLNPPYTHVQLTSVNTSNQVLNYQNLPGWPDPSTFNGLTSPFGDNVEFWAAFFRNGVLVPGTSRTLLVPPFSNNALAIGGWAGSAPWAQAPTLSTLQPGDTIAVTARGSGSPILVWGCDSITLSNVKVHGSPTWGININHSSNTTIDHVRVEPRPGSGQVGANADGIHFFSTLQNNLIRDCYVTRTMDDALIFDNQFVATVASQGPLNTLTLTQDYFSFPAGELLDLVDPDSTLEIRGAHVVSQFPPFNDVMTPYPQEVLTFDQNLPSAVAGFGVVYGDASNRGQGSTIEDNTVEDLISGRGIWINGVQGVTVRRNVLRRTAQAGIAVQRSTGNQGFLAGPTSNVVIQDNVMEGVLGYAACGTFVQVCMGSLEAETDRTGQQTFSLQPADTGLTVANNYIADAGRSGIWLGEVSTGTLQNNLIIRSSRNPTLSGTFGILSDLASQVMQDALVPVVIRYSSSVTETGDTVSATSGIAAPVTMSSSGTAIAGGAGSANVTIQTAINAFAWKATSDSPWLAVTSGPLGAGNGTVQFSVAPNSTGSIRTGNITVAGETYVVAQTTAATVRCNVTGGATTTITDLQKIINEAVGVEPASDDLNNDGVVNVVDIQMVIDALFGLGC